MPRAAPAVTPEASEDAAPEPGQPAPSAGLGLPENLAGVLAYFIFPAIAFLLIQPFKRNRFVRFHSIQCLLTVGVLILLQIALVLLGKVLPLLVLSLYGLLSLAAFTLLLLLVYKAYRHEMFRLPVVGDISEAVAARN